MTIEHNNALRSIARQANCEIKKDRQQFPDKNVDDICRSVLKKHRETVTLMGFTPTHLSLAIGMLNGVFKERGNMKSKIIRELQAPFLLFAFTLKRINQQFRD